MLVPWQKCWCTRKYRIICIRYRHNLGGSELQADKYCSSSRRYLKVTDDVGALDTLAVESLGPLDEYGLGEPLLLQGEGEGEAQGENLSLQLPVVHKVGQTPAHASKIMVSVVDPDLQGSGSFW
jgi:hypothetical protein